MSKHSSGKIASLAGSVLADPSASKIQKALAGSVVSQSGTEKATGSKLGSLASNVLNSDKYNATTKELAGSVLSQAGK
jgi:hypothetical protein